MIIYLVNPIFLIHFPMDIQIMAKLKKKIEKKFSIILLYHKVEH
jgi:hypothetical protein